MGGDLLAWTTCVSLDVDRRRWNCVIRTVIVVVVAIVVVAIPVVIDAVHDDHPGRLDPFPRAERTDAPQWNGRSRPVVRMARDMAVADPRRRRMMAWLWTGVAMPCGGWAGRGGMMSRAGPCCRSRGMMSRAGPRCWPRSMRRSTCRLGRPSWASVAARTAARMTTPGSGECCRAECRAGDSDECEFHEVVVHNAPSLSVLSFDGRAHLALTPSKAARVSVPDKTF